ncbi:hypothetical protein [Capillimicrobium parvum]|uniref:Uncharacterized protein n=1 Tax=Capillimicrobium parvum TaxID=2884022 RepID=A0A9E6XVL3_9ACTN|nr:hypothetical protein [Capillimicrobium parvum]UGS35005.1 hypothetical protein DSM104329_01389 [Capillimicrobium parvum]
MDGERDGVRSHTLHAALRRYVEEVSWTLAAETADGAEVPFELVEERGVRRTALYCYRPLVDEFLRERFGALARLDGHVPAARALGAHDGIARYLKAHHEPVPSDAPGRAHAALSLFLERVYAEQTTFEFDNERFERAYAQLEELIFAGRTHAAAIVAVLGLDIASPEIVLADGLTLTRAETFDDLPAELRTEADVVAAFRAEVEDGAPDPFVQAGRAFRRLLVALRLYDDGGVALGSVAWTRVDSGAWRSAALGAGGIPQGLTLIEADEEDELRGFCSLVARRTPRSGELAWALSRYGMACERTVPAEALSDVLLALRALLEPEGPASGRLPGRLAALCAVPEDRVALAERASQAIALERAIIAGTAPHSPAVDELIAELSGYLRALLRDVLCGHLDADVRGLADRLLVETPA